MVAKGQEQTPAPPPRQQRYSITIGFEIRAQIIWAKDRFALSRAASIERSAAARALSSEVVGEPPA